MSCIRRGLLRVMTAAAVPVLVPAVAGPADAGAGPTVRCTAPDGEWHPENVAVHCTAADPQGLSDRGDRSFDLWTTVPAGGETASASTGSREVCDTGGNCVTAGPVRGNRVDLKPPTVVLRQPAQDGRYGLLARHGVRFTCGDAGSGIYSCQGTQPVGSQVPTGVRSLGPHTFTAIAEDRAGNRTKVRHAYRIELVVAGAGQ